MNNLTNIRGKRSNRSDFYYKFSPQNLQTNFKKSYSPFKYLVLKLLGFSFKHFPQV